MFLLACSTEAPPPPPSLPASPPVAAVADPVPPVVEVGRLTFVATGDLLLHTAVQEAGEARTWDSLYATLRPRLSSADVAFVNLESPIAPHTGRSPQPYVFNAPAEVLGSLASTGFDVVSFANNHVYDQGRAGFVETLEHLAAAKLAWVGAGRTCEEARAPRMFTANGVTVALLGTSELFNEDENAGPDEPCADLLDRDRLLAGARAARAAGADAVVLSVHWGREYETAPSPAQVTLARELVDGGFDVILGHHPHVLGPIEVRHTSDGRSAVIAYSLGNFVSNQSAWYEPGLNGASSGNPRDGVLLRFAFARRSYGIRDPRVERVEVRDLVAIPLWTLNDAPVRGEGPPRIEVVATNDRLEQLRAKLTAATNDREIVSLAAEVEALEARVAEVAGIVGEQFLVEPDDVRDPSGG